MDLTKISYSALRDYIKCPRLFLFRKILYLPLKTKQIELLFGGAVHRAIELYQKGIEKDVFKTFNTEFPKHRLSTEEQKNYQEYFYRGNRILKSYVEYQQTFAKIHGIEFAESEQGFTIENAVDPITGKPCKIPKITGIVDFIAKDTSLGDYKTSKKKYTQEDVDESLQPDFYYLWYYNKYGVLPKRFVYIVLLKEHKRDNIQVLETHRTLEDLSKLVEKINWVYAKVAENDYHVGCQNDAYCDCRLYDQIFNLK